MTSVRSVENKLDNYVNLDNFKYKLFPIDPVPTQIAKTFDNLVHDQYLQSSFQYRSRRYACGKLHQRKFTFLEQQLFFQNKYVNKLIGGVQRDFPTLEKETKSYIESEIMEKLYAEILDPEKSYSIGIHQIRIWANHHSAGLPAPEGVHQDGFDFVSILVVNLNNVCGAKNLLLDVETQKNLKYEAYLPENTIFMFNDRAYSHYATAVTPKIPGDAVRDIFVFSVNEERS